MSLPTVASAACGLVQIIELEWGKASRGGEGARRRAAVPLALEVPVEDWDAAGGALHVEESHWREANGFAEPVHRRQQRISLGEELRFRGASVSSHPQGLAVRYRWNAAEGGAPDRSYLDSGDLVLQEGQWGRICWNGRFRDADTGHWWYRQVTVNVAWFGCEPSGRVFLAGPPVHDLRLLSDLW